MTNNIIRKVLYLFFKRFVEMKEILMSDLKLLLKISCFSLLFAMMSCKGQTDEPKKALIQTDPQLEALSAEISKNPKNGNAYYNRAQYYYEIEGYDEAIYDLASAMKFDSLKPAYYHLLADTYLDYFQSRMALLTMQKAVGMFPDSIHTLLKLSEFQLIMKKHDEAMQTIKTILEKDKQNADAYLMMGSVLEETGDKKRALLAYKKATEINPFMTDAWIKTGVLADEMKEKNAVRYFKTALRVDSVSYQAMYAMAMHHQNRNELKDAIQWYRKLNLTFPKLAQPYFNMGILHNEMDSLDKAIEFLTIATSLDKIYAEAYYAKGVVLEKQGKLTEAQKQYSQASTLSPKFIQAEQASQRLKNELKK